MTGKVATIRGKPIVPSKPVVPPMFDDELPDPTQPEERVIEVFTDGSCVGNGKGECYAGVGVYYGDGDPRNVSMASEGDDEGPPTNQSTELMALVLATQEGDRLLREGLADRVHIFSDSQYGINCATVWYRNWLRNGWLNSSGKPVAHRRKIEVVAQRLEMWAGKLRLVKIKAHVGHAGNEAADQLARGAAERLRDEVARMRRDSLTPEIYAEVRRGAAEGRRQAASLLRDTTTPHRPSDPPPPPPTAAPPDLPPTHVALRSMNRYDVDYKNPLRVEVLPITETDVELA
jgi:ribonuclease HI